LSAVEREGKGEGDPPGKGGGKKGDDVISRSFCWRQKGMKEKKKKKEKGGRIIGGKKGSREVAGCLHSIPSSYARKGKDGVKLGGGEKGGVEGSP